MKLISWLWNLNRPTSAPEKRDITFEFTITDWPESKEPAATYQGLKGTFTFRGKVHAFFTLEGLPLVALSAHLSDWLQDRAPSFSFSSAQGQNRGSMTFLQETLTKWIVRSSSCTDWYTQLSGKGLRIAAYNYTKELEAILREKGRWDDSFRKGFLWKARPESS